MSSLISFDIGIKNMAFCMFLFPPSSTTPFLIEQWNVLNLMEKEESTEKCTNSLKSKIQKPKKTKKTEKEKEKKKKKNIISLENFIIERKDPES